MVSDPKLATLGPKYETRYAVVDSSDGMVIKIQRPGEPQSIRILEFLWLGENDEHPYPDALVKLGCSIKKLRPTYLGNRFCSTMSVRGSWNVKANPSSD